MQCEPLSDRLAPSHRAAVTIGSYPWTGETPAAYKVEICCTSRDKEALEAAVGAIREAIPCIEK